MNKDVYVIRPGKDNTYGLGALIIEVLKYTQYAERKGFIPYVDWSGTTTQYSDNSIENVWNYYFSQPIKQLDYTDSMLEFHYSEERDLLTIEDDVRIKKEFKPSIKLSTRELFDKYYSFSKEINTQCEQEMIPCKGLIGILLRGTDYSKLKPEGHAIQPNIEDAFKVIDRVIRKTGLNDLFLVTEDYTIMDLVYKKYGENLVRLKSDYQIKNYNGRVKLSLDNDSLEQLGRSPKERGAQYLKKLILLSKCDYLIAGNTCGSWFSYIISDTYRDVCVFDLGKY